MRHASQTICERPVDTSTTCTVQQKHARATQQERSAASRPSDAACRELLADMRTSAGRAKLVALQAEVQPPRSHLLRSTRPGKLVKEVEKLVVLFSDLRYAGAKVVSRHSPQAVCFSFQGLTCCSGCSASRCLSSRAATDKLNARFC